MYIIVIILGICSLFCFGYFIYAASYTGLFANYAILWLMATIFFLASAITLYFMVKNNIWQQIPKTLKIIVGIILAAGILLFVFVEGLIISGMSSEAQPEADYVIVLGAKVNGETVSRSLAYRLDAAAEYLHNNKDTMVIVSGGQGPGEDISEAEAMKRYLINEGIDANRITMEDKSTSTKENLLFSAEFITDKSSRVVIATNNFHVYRAMRIAKKNGYENVEGLPAKSYKPSFVTYMVREALAIVKEKIMGNI